MKNQVAVTILKQLGNNKFIVMTGAKNLTAFENALSFKVGRGNTRINYVKIILTPADEYDMEFYYIRKGTPILERAFRGVYCDQLQELFTEATGLYTSLGSMGGAM